MKKLLALLLIIYFLTSLSSVFAVAVGLLVLISVFGKRF